MEFIAKITAPNNFIPIGDDSFKKSLKLKIGDFIKLESWKERNVNFHRKYFAFLNTTIYFLPEDKKFDKLRNIEYLRKEIMIIIGEVDVHISMDGTQHLTPKSISFKSMDNERFEYIYSMSVNAALRYFIRDIPKSEFENHILSFL